jgi:hypothetical protein
MEHTTQLISKLEKAKEMIQIKEKKDRDILLFWHYETIKDDLIDEYLKEVF